jgi:hypothetical protein
MYGVFKNFSPRNLQNLNHESFSVEAVSDMFFKGYKQQYEDIIFYVTGKRMVKVANKWEERQEKASRVIAIKKHIIHIIAAV